jgi:hypothetical protein
MRSRAICSANLHSRIIDSMGAARPFMRCGREKSGRRSHGPESKRWLQMRFASQITLLRAAAVSAAVKETFQLPGNNAPQGNLFGKSHSRIIDSTGAVRPFVRYGCGRSGRRSNRPASKRWLQMRFASQITLLSAATVSVVVKEALQSPTKRRV